MERYRSRCRCRCHSQLQAYISPTPNISSRNTLEQKIGKVFPIAGGARFISSSRKELGYSMSVLCGWILTGACTSRHMYNLDMFSQALSFVLIGKLHPHFRKLNLFRLSWLAFSASFMLQNRQKTNGQTDGRTDIWLGLCMPKFGREVMKKKIKLQEVLLFIKQQFASETANATSKTRGPSSTLHPATCCCDEVWW